MAEVERYCNRCHLVSPINCIKKNRKNAYNKICENCLVTMRKYHHENKEAIAMLQTYYKNNIEAFRIYSKQWRMENREKCANFHRAYYLENKTKLLEYGQEYVNTHREKIREYQQEYYQKHRERKLEQFREYNKTRRRKAIQKALTEAEQGEVK